MKITKVEGYIFLKHHTYISAEAFYNGKSILFYTQQKLNEDEPIPGKVQNNIDFPL
ncbi:MAG: hypothetical protein P8Y23_06150 [Candidatus Lokiarchaeota archaeon]